jgi:hypothetical protein
MPVMVAGCSPTRRARALGLTGPLRLGVRQLVRACGWTLDDVREADAACDGLVILEPMPLAGMTGLA